MSLATDSPHTFSPLHTMSDANSIHAFRQSNIPTFNSIPSPATYDSHQQPRFNNRAGYTTPSTMRQFTRATHVGPPAASVYRRSTSQCTLFPSYTPNCTSTTGCLTNLSLTTPLLCQPSHLPFPVLRSLTVPDFSSYHQPSGVSSRVPSLYLASPCKAPPPNDVRTQNENPHTPTPFAASQPIAPSVFTHMPPPLSRRSIFHHPLLPVTPSSAPKRRKSMSLGGGDENAAAMTPLALLGRKRHSVSTCFDELRPALGSIPVRHIFSPPRSRRRLNYKAQVGVVAAL